jgi:hypothetical protein
MARKFELIGWQDLSLRLVSLTLSYYALSLTVLNLLFSQGLGCESDQGDKSAAHNRQSDQICEIYLPNF